MRSRPGNSGTVVSIPWSRESWMQVRKTNMAFPAPNPQYPTWPQPIWAAKSSSVACSPVHLYCLVFLAVNCCFLLKGPQRSRRVMTLINAHRAAAANCAPFVWLQIISMAMATAVATCSLQLATWGCCCRWPIKHNSLGTCHWMATQKFP